MFIDASAAVAIILNEADRDELRLKLRSSSRRTMSALASYETVMAVRRVTQLPVQDASETVLQFQNVFAIKSVAIEDRFTAVALDAFQHYGRGQGNRANLNMGDCFAYACAKILKMPLLCKGDDFIHTDIRIA